ncbi:MAG TPA: 2-oxoacid:acceptor oxidoreductase family protein [bacterium]|nr:2-oxoacid:acceptor oxidoreductase family protein [bacterium]HQG46242.1 2-oxoacid:acceptor oxidoreductase family protein [bacterium]HQI48920.1 2-oxoacid:acceptor oxidoreductase family protein [bacterium]HQJ62976.1 2-oxoacid:acceptor oxidoreductase family protein [bacterium]
MKELRFHGRGGQGTVLASIALAKAFFQAGYWVQTFPVFGSERRGAPVEAYLRLDTAQIYLRSNIYAPDHVVVQDAGLLTFLDVTRGLKPGGWILLNTPALPADLRPFEGFCLACIDASAIARAHGLGSKTQPITNTAMMGAFSRLFSNPPLDTVLQAIEREVPVKIEENIAAARAAFDAATLHGQVHGTGFLPMAGPRFRKAVS